MLIYFFRFIFIVTIVAVLIVSLSSDEISGEQGRANFWVILWSGLGLAVVALFVDIFTPKKSLAALAGVCGILAPTRPATPKPHPIRFQRANLRALGE